MNVSLGVKDLIFFKILISLSLLVSSKIYFICSSSLLLVSPFSIKKFQFQIEGEPRKSLIMLFPCSCYLFYFN